MKYLPIFVLFLSLPQLTQAQDTLWISEDADIVSRKQAAYFRILSEGPPWTIEEYYYPSQQPKLTGSYPSEESRDQGTSHNGLWTSYSGDGTIIRKIEYQDGLKDGNDSSWYEDGILASVKVYQKGKYGGKFEEWYDNGNLSESREYGSEGNLVGLWETYYPNGQLSRSVDLSSTDTTVVSYHHNGQVAYSGQRETGRLVINTAYSAEGELEVKNGKGTFELFENGVLREKGKIKRGLRQGLWTFFREDGTKRMQVTYVNSVSYQASLFDIQGKNPQTHLVSLFSLIDDQNPYSQVKIASPIINSKVLTVYTFVQSIGYPNKAHKENGIEGEVIVKLLISEDGEVIQMEFVQRVHPLLDDLIERNISLLTCTPAVVDNERRQFSIDIPFVFELGY